ncbi:hypothetical protein F2Q68_00044140 [Brassica cretica]|uniref:Uncharacterized protein n=2 Tax=Brassica cretica TaxID=69181 RepID=A0A8S9LG39_BRACR|nr:hypothetical protein F2Q68_00044140 [Brassica cretica]KAF3518822.1 hypothetical protein DY000_02060172 [Brassica cretica]
MIQESLQLATVEPSTRHNTQRLSKLTLQHRSTVANQNRPTQKEKNRSTVVKENGKRLLHSHYGNTHHAYRGV